MTLTLQAANALVIGAAITNTGGSGKLYLALDADDDLGVHDGHGAIVLNSDIATGGGDIALGTGATMVVNGVATLVGGDVTVAGSGLRTLSTAGGNVTFAGQLNSDALVTASPLAVQAGAGTVTVASAVGGLAPLASIDVSAGAVHLDGGSAVTTGAQAWNAPIASGAGIVLSGSQIALNGATTAFNGNVALTASAGEIQINADLAASSGDIALVAGGGVTGSGGIHLAGGAPTLTITQAGNSTYAGIVSGANAVVTKTGAGILGLSGTNTWAGGLNLAGGELELDSPDAIGSTGTIAFAGGTLRFSGANGVDYSPRFSNAPGQLYSIDTNNRGVEFNSVLGSVGGTMTKWGGDYLGLYANNTYDGGSTINAGTLFGGGASQGTTVFGSGPITVNAGARLWTDRSTLSNALVLNGGLLTGSNGFGERWLGNISVTADSTIEAQYYMEFGGAVTGSGQLTKTSGGTLLFTGADSRTASTIVNSGTLQIGNGTTGSIAGDIQVDSGANLRFNRTDSLTYGGTITGAGTVEQAGNNTLTLTGASTYTGATTLSNGALIVENDHPVLTTSGYFGPGILAIKPASTSFSSPFTFNTPTSSLGFLVLGWPGNTADIDVAIATSVSNLIYVIGGNIRLGANLSATAPGSLFYAVATGDIVQASGVTVSTNGGNILYQSDFDASGGGYIWLQGQGANTRITSAGGDITLTGGTNTTTGYAQGRATGNGNGITLDDATLDSGGGNIVLRGQGSTGAASPIANTDGTAFNTDGVRLYGSNLIDSGTGTLKIAGRAQGLNSSNGIELSTTGVSTLASASNAATAIELVGDSTNLAASDSFGLYTWGNTIAATGTGGVTLYGAGRDGGLVVAANASVLANGGSILLEGVRTTGSNTGLTIQGMVGQRAASVVPTSTSNIVLSADTLVVTGTVQASGALTLQPYSAGASVGVGGGAGTLQLPQSLFGGPVVNGFSHVTIGRADGTGTLEVGDFALGTPLTLLNGSGDIALAGALDLGAQTMTLAGNGNVAETGVGRITSARLFLDGSAGTYTLGATTNHVGTLAGNVDGVDFVNGGALTIGTVDGVDGIVAATGRIAVATTSGDLSVAKGVSTSSTAADAIVLDAGGSADPDTVAGGDIVLVASPRIAVGAGGRATLYTGSIAGSTGVVDLVGSGSGNFRYHSDEATANFTSALGSGTFAVFREQPTLTVTATDAGKTYDANAWSGGNGFTGAGYVNGDSAMLLTGTPAYGGAAQGRVDAGSAALGVGGLANGAGYAIAYVDGTLVVAPKVVTVSATKVYDGSTALVGAVSLDTGIAGQTLTYTGATSSNAHVAASGKYIAAITLADGTGLASNYTLPTLDAANAPVTITRQGVRAIGTIGGTLTKVYDGTDAAPGATLSTHVVYAIAGDTLAVDTSGWTVRYDGTHVVDTTAMVAQGLFPHLSVATTGSGSLASDYLLVAMAIPVTPGSITTKALGATAAIAGTSTKVYDGTNVALGATVGGSVSGAIAGDTIALDASGIALAYDGAHVAGTTAIVASGAATFAIGSSTAGSVASDYSFTAPSIANAAASIAPKALGATAAIGGTLGKVYDGTSAAIGAAVGGSVSGAISGDTLALDTSGIALAYDGTHVVGTTAIVASGASTFAIGSSTAGSV
ncbi:MAG: autotransporter-associated beta strand repeat-containing protein, partial [Betaproteobacteria bacterium]